MRIIDIKMSMIKDLEYENYCLGCESGTDNFYSHQYNGYYHPQCNTLSAMRERKLHAKDQLTRLKTGEISFVLYKEFSDNILNYIKETRDYKFAQDCLECYNNCKCCETHKVNKPLSIDTNISMCILCDNKIQKDCECECDCRHLAITICRIFNSV